MIDAVGVSKTLEIFGIILVAVICIGSFFLAKCPQTAAAAGSGNAAPAAKGAAADVSWKEMLRHPIFYVLLLLLACGSLMGMLIISQASSVAQEMVGTSVAAATAVVSLIAVFNTFGRLACGYVSDKIGRINVITIAIVIALTGLILAYFSAGGSTALFAVGACMVGLCFGCFMGVYPSFTADHFGIRNNTLNYGVMFLGNSIGAIVGPSLMTGIHKSAGTYQPAFLAAAALAVAGLALTLIYRHMARMGKTV